MARTAPGAYCAASARSLALTDTTAPYPTPGGYGTPADFLIAAGLYGEIVPEIAAALASFRAMPSPGLWGRLVRAVIDHAPDVAPLIAARGEIEERRQPTPTPNRKRRQ